MFCACFACGAAVTYLSAYCPIRHRSVCVSLCLLGCPGGAGGEPRRPRGPARLFRLSVPSLGLVDRTSIQWASVWASASLCPLCYRWRSFTAANRRMPFLCVICVICVICVDLGSVLTQYLCLSVILGFFVSFWALGVRSARNSPQCRQFGTLRHLHVPLALCLLFINLDRRLTRGLSLSSVSIVAPICNALPPPLSFDLVSTAASSLAAVLSSSPVYCVCSFALFVLVSPRLRPTASSSLAPGQSHERTTFARSAVRQSRSCPFSRRSVVFLVSGRLHM